MEIKFIIIITVALFFIALVQLMKIYDLAAKVRGEKSQEKLSRSENLLMAILMLVFMAAFFGFIIWLVCLFRDLVKRKDHGNDDYTLLKKTRLSSIC